MSTPEQKSAGFDPEAEQEVDFAKYARQLAARWWLLAAGLVLGAVVGYAVSLGGSQVYSASSTVYLGQPYSAGGGPLQTLQTNMSTVNAIVESESVLRKISKGCKAKPADFRGGIAAHAVVGALSKNNQNPIVKVTVQGKRAKETACAANALAQTVVAKTASFANEKIQNLRSRISTDQQYVSTIRTSIENSAISTTDRLLIQLQLRNYQEDEINANQLLLQAEQVEAPKVLTGAVAEKVTARSRRNTVIVAALVGLLIGALLALFWDRLAPRLSPRNGE